MWRVYRRTRKDEDCGGFIGVPERMKTMWRVYRRTRKDEDYVEGL